MDQPVARNTFTRAITWLEHLSRPALLGFTFGIFTLVALVDYATGYEISCTVFYLVAIGIATWFLGAGSGIFFSLLSAVEYIRLFALSVEAKENRRKEKDAARDASRA